MVTDDLNFPQEMFEVFEHIFTHSWKKIAVADKEELLNSLLIEVMNHIIAYKNAISVADTPDLRPGMDGKCSRNQLIAEIYHKDNSIHPALSASPASEMEYLRGVAHMLLTEVLPADYKLDRTPLHLIEQMIVENALLTVIDIVSDPFCVFNMIRSIFDGADDDETGDAVRSITAAHCGIGISKDCFQLLPKVLVPDDSVNDLLDKDIENNLRNEHSTNDDENNAFKVDMSVSQSSSIASHLSDDSHEDALDPKPDMPLPLILTELHFAPEGSEDDKITSHPLCSDTVGREMHHKFFHRIRIPEVNIITEVYDTSKRYALYKITYTTRDEYPVKDSLIKINTGEVTICSNKHEVQRRFREFLALQERLSQNSEARKLIIHIKGPSRMFPVPFGNMDYEYIEQRKKFLQAYLREISSIPFISQTRELQEFLAYGMDPRIAYVKKTEPMPRFDKLLKSAIQDFLGSTSMQFAENSSVAERRLQKEYHEIANVGAVSKIKNKMFGASKIHDHKKVIVSRARRHFAKFQPEYRAFKFAWREGEDITLLGNEVSEDRIQHTRGSGDGCDAVKEDGLIERPHSLPAKLLLKLYYFIWNISSGKHALSVLCLIRHLQCYLFAKLAELTSLESWSNYVSVFDELLWPNSEWGFTRAARPTWGKASDETKRKVIGAAERCVEDALPHGLRFLVGKKEIKSGVRVLLRTFENKNINRHLFYRLLDDALTAVLK